MRGAAPGVPAPGPVAGPPRVVLVVVPEVPPVALGTPLIPVGTPVIPVGTPVIPVGTPGVVAGGVTTTLDPLSPVAPPEAELEAGGTLRTAAPPPGRTQVTSRSEQ